MKGFHRMSRWIACFLIPLFTITCASTSLPPLSLNPGTQLESDERRLWEKSAQEQKKLDASQKIINDPLLEEYLQEMAWKLTPAKLKNSDTLKFQFKVIHDPALNAFAYANGKIYIHSGLIARVENEAQLATVVGHEMIHTINRHTVRAIRDARNKQVFYIGGIIALSVLMAYLTGERMERGDFVGAALLNNTARLLVGLGLPLAVLASIKGYARDLESEADDGGMGLLADAGYDVNEAPKVFEHFQETYGDSTAIENFFFGSHPRNNARIANYQSMLGGPYAKVARQAGRVRDTEAFQLRRRVIVRENARLDIKAGRYNVARAALDKVLAITPNDPRAHYYHGEIHRLSDGSEQGRQKAIESYEKAVSYDPELAGAYKGLGLLHYKQKNREKAKEAFRKYLELRPKAEDRQQIKDYLVELGE